MGFIRSNRSVRHIAAATLCVVALWGAACDGTAPVKDGDSGTGADAGGDAGLPDAPPLANAGPDQVALRGQRITLSGLATVSRAGGELVFEWHQVSGLAVVLSNNSAPVATFTAPAEAGDLSFELRAGDQGGTGYDVVVISVAGEDGVAKDAPLASAGGDRSSPGGTTMKLDGEGSLAAGERRYLWNAAGAGLQIVNPTSSAPDLNIAQGAGAGIVKLEVSSDGLFSAPDYARVAYGPEAAVTDASPAPAIENPEVYTNPGDRVSLAGEGETIYDAWAWRQVAGDPVTIQGGDTAGASFNAPDRVCRLAFAYKAQKNGLWSAPAFKVVHVWAREGFQLPIADAGGDLRVALKENVVLDGGLSTVDARRTITWRWEQTGGTPVTLSDPAVAKPEFTAPAIASTLTFVLSVYDGVVWSAPDTVVVRAGGN